MACGRQAVYFGGAFHVQRCFARESLELLNGVLVRRGFVLFGDRMGELFWLEAQWMFIARVVVSAMEKNDNTLWRRGKLN